MNDETAQGSERIVGDREQLIAMLDRARIIWQPIKVYEGTTAQPSTLTHSHPTDFVVEQGRGPNNLGYGGFWTEFKFKGDGTLISVGSWE